MNTTDWFTALAVRTEPLVDPPRLPSGDWRQDAELPEPLWDTSAAAIARRVSIENGHNVYALVLDPSDGALDVLLNMAGWSQHRQYHVGVIESADPVADGYLRRLHVFTGRDAPAQPVEPAALFRAFMRAESLRIPDIEPWLRARYGDHPVGDIFERIDYPVFDCGTMCLADALLLHGPELHFWSRVRHAHK
jgi:hypothetical protein